jgi:hypothetical protein
VGSTGAARSTGPRTGKHRSERSERGAQPRSRAIERAGAVKLSSPPQKRAGAVKQSSPPQKQAEAVSLSVPATTLPHSGTHSRHRATNRPEHFTSQTELCIAKYNYNTNFIATKTNFRMQVTVADASGVGHSVNAHSHPR